VQKHTWFLKTGVLYGLRCFASTKEHNLWPYTTRIPFETTSITAFAARLIWARQYRNTSSPKQQHAYAVVRDELMLYGNAVGCSTTGSSEAAMLGSLAEGARPAGGVDFLGM